MKLGIYNPYLDTLGGGERYAFSLAEFLLKKGWEIDFFWNNKAIIPAVEKRFGIDIRGVKISADLHQLFSKKGKISSKFQLTRKYDLIFFVSDGSIPWLFAKKNIILFQAPFHHVNGRALINRLKLKNIDRVICYSKFVKEIIDNEFDISAVVLPPFVDDEFGPAEKENIIISVGRFDNLLHSKRHDVLIKSFKEIYKQGLKNWRLYLIGGARHGKDLVKRLRKEAFGFPIEIISDISFKDLVKCYSRSKIYWHAAGFGIDEEKEPEKMEHFGITTIEAMKSGAVPIVFEGGGQKEILRDNKNGLFWNTQKELVKHTLKVINDKKLFLELSKESQKRAKDFSKDKFNKMVEEIFEL